MMVHSCHQYRQTVQNRDCDLIKPICLLVNETCFDSFEFRVLKLWLKCLSIVKTKSDMHKTYHGQKYGKKCRLSNQVFLVVYAGPSTFSFKCPRLKFSVYSRRYTVNMVVDSAEMTLVSYTPYWTLPLAEQR